MFARLFERDDEQVLVTLSKDGAGTPTIHFSFQVSDCAFDTRCVSWRFSEDDLGEKFDFAKSVFYSMALEEAFEVKAEVMAEIHNQQRCH